MTIKVKAKRRKIVAVSAKKQLPKAAEGRGLAGLQGLGLVLVGKELKLELREQLKMTRNVFGRVVNVSERTLAHVESQAKDVEKLKRTYNEVYRLKQALSEVVESSSLPGWFASPNKALGGFKPVEIIERGEIDRLWDMVYRLRSGIPG